MKSLYLSIIYCSCLVGPAYSQNIYDDFDTYKADEYLGNESGGLWTTWSLAPGGGEDVLVNETTSFSPNNSINLVSGGAMDVVLPLGDQYSGEWTISFMMQIESGYGAYFNVLHDFAAAASNWAVQVYFNASGSGNLTVGGGATDLGTQFTHPVGSWFEIKINIDIDSDVAEIYFDDVPQYTWMWSQGSVMSSPYISGLNLYPNAQDGQSDSYFVDNVSFSTYDLSLTESDEVQSCYPNPANQTFTINHQEGSFVEVFNLLGGTVFSTYSKELSSHVDCSLWPKSTYLLQLTSSDGSVKRKNIVVQ
jgi:hypothetical protein